ncbi:MAG: ABC-2 family transporter protein [Clostridia bacterium]|nr:ABC-2 family transporter protein [Clostridia bacterium]
MLKKYKPFLRAGAMDTLSYRFNILIWAVITVFQVACLVFLWLAVYRSSAGGMDAEIHGFTFREMIAYVVLTTVFNYVTFNNDTLWNINNDIRKGTIGNYLIKPISYRGKFAATSFGSLLTMTLLFGIPFYAAALLTLGGLGFLPDLSFPAFFVHLGLFLVAGLFASLLNDVIAYIFGVFCFYTTASWGLNSLKETLISFLSGTLLPLAFFPAGLREVVSWMPFAGMSQNPVLILMMKYDLAESLRCLALTGAWIVALELFAKLLFSHAIRKVTVQGG